MSVLSVYSWYYVQESFLDAPGFLWCWRMSWESSTIHRLYRQAPDVLCTLHPEKTEFLRRNKDKRIYLFLIL